ncbi:MAG: hypothetical protein ACAI25_18995 [Planctomycetota bacterium]
MLRRVLTYFVEMFPPWVTLPAAAIHFLAVELGLQALAGVQPLLLSWRSLVGTLGVLFFQLALRTQDELKDVETDRALAAAGDPKYIDRAIVKGRVLPEDLVLLRWVALIGGLAVSAALGQAALIAYAVVGGLVWASGHWFWIPSMKKNLLLAFATHNPLAAGISCWCVAATLPEVPGVSRWAAPLVVGIWTPVAAWEVARKIRMPEDETDYTTYSKLLGAKTAAAIVGLLVLASAGALGFVAVKAGAHAGYFAALGLGALVAVGATLAFVFAPTRGRAKLQPVTELYAGVAGLGFVIALAAQHGVRV